MCYLLAQFGRHTLHQDDGGAGFFVGNGVVEQGLGFVAFALDFVAAEGMDGLGGEADVGADGDAAQLQELGGFGHPDAAFEFDHMRACGHQFGGGGEGLFFALLVGAEGQVGYNHGVFAAACDGGGVVAHVVQADGQGGIASLDGHAQGVAHQKYVHARFVHQGGKAGFIGGEHGDFFAFGLHFIQCVYGNHVVLIVFQVEVVAVALHVADGAQQQLEMVVVVCEVHVVVVGNQQRGVVVKVEETAVFFVDLVQVARRE